MYPNSNPVFGLNGGVTVGFEIQNFTLSSGIQYIQKGAEYQTANFEDEVGTGFFTGKEKLHYLSIPVLVGYREYIAPRFALSIAIGPSFNFGLGGNLDETTEYFGTDEVKMDNYKILFGNGLNEDYRPVELEGFGLATVEAMACGLPVIGTPVGGTVEILQALDANCLFPNATVEGMARRLETYLNDPEPFHALGLRCREQAVAEYDWGHVTDRIEEEFALLLSR